MTQPTRLSIDEVLARWQRGQGNNVTIETSRSYREILISNLLNLINVILFTIGAIMIAIGRFSDAVAGVGLILFNVVVGVIQETRAKHVPHASYANRLTANARKLQLTRTPLQREIDFVLRLIIVLAIFIGGVQLIGTVISQVPLMRQVQMADVIAGLVPNGLFVMVIVAYAIGARRIAQCGALVQQANAIESLSNVTLLCTDKTGTLTANAILYEDSYPFPMPISSKYHSLRLKPR